MIANKECFINLSTLIASPYSLEGGDDIYAKVSATNAYGESNQSTEGLGAVYTRAPDSPTSLTEDVSLRSTTELGLTW